VKEIRIVIYQRDFVTAWHYDFDTEGIRILAQELTEEYRSAGVRVIFSKAEDLSVRVSGYGDILNAVKLRSAAGSHCLGHIIGESKNRDLLEDARRGISKLAFAPETIMPEAAHRKVCHNCGCGC